MGKSFIIDSFPDCAEHYRSGYAVVAIDVIRATTMAITAVDAGRRCYPVDSIEAAIRLAPMLRNPIFAGEINGSICPGLQMNNSPSELIKRSDISRPLILLSTSGTRLIANARGSDTLYLACFRNSVSMGCRLITEKHARIALLGAGSRGEFREEDQICCAWIAALLARAGYAAENEATVQVLNRWGHAKASDCLVSRSVDYLRRTGQLADLHFILERIDDIDDTFILRDQQVVRITPDVRLNRQPEYLATY
jgi:2-phosphosulfolactate phosphatase